MSDLPEEHDACHGDVVIGMLQMLGQQLGGVNKLGRRQPPSEGDGQLAASRSVE